MTAAQFVQQQTDRLNQLEQDTYPIEKASQDIKKEMVFRIFSEGKNAKGELLLSVKGYDTDPLYISTSIVGQVGTFVGKKGTVVKNKSKNTINAGAKNKEIKSAYFPKGYKELKSKLGRPVLELTGEMQKDLANGFTQIINAGRAVLTFKKNENALKMLGNEFGNRYWKGRGLILAATESEADTFARSHTNALIEKGYL